MRSNCRKKEDLTQNNYNLESKIYDFVIIGSGLGGLECAYILASEGYSVIVLEKNRQLGGSMQVFSRDKRVFDTGVHYIGGLDEGQNMYQFFKYFGILDRVKFKKLDIDGFDRIKFKGDDHEYLYGQGYDNFKKLLVKDFPEEEKAINAYCDKIIEITKEFPMYNIDNSLDPDYFAKDYLTIDTAGYISSLTENVKLRNVFAGTKMLYAGVQDETPLYVHALVINSYIESAYRCVDGGSRIAVQLAKNIKKVGGKILLNTKVVSSTFESEQKKSKMTSVILEDGREIKAKNFISNIAPSPTIDLVGENRFNKAYVHRIKKIKKTISSFTLHLALEKDTVKYLNHNIYYIDSDNVWDIADYNESNWPKAVLVSMPYSKNTNEYSDVVSFVTYMNFSEVEPWKDTFSTDSHKNDRGQTYKAWKKSKEQILLDLIDKEILPGIKEHVVSVDSSTPLTYRDYIGNEDGALYGSAKDYKSPMKTFVNTRTKVPNLLLTGQFLNLHGVLGVTVSSFVTCFEFIDRNYLVEKVKSA